MYTNTYKYMHYKRQLRIVGSPCLEHRPVGGQGVPAVAQHERNLRRQMRPYATGGGGRDKGLGGGWRKQREQAAEPILGMQGRSKAGLRQI